MIDFYLDARFPSSRVVCTRELPQIQFEGLCRLFHPLQPLEALGSAGMPPYADNLYSGDDDGVSDTESFSEELTPSDGYFHRANMPSHGRLVLDPTIDYGPAEAKTLIESPDMHPRTRAGPSHGSSAQAMSSSSLASSPSFVSPEASREYTPVSPVSSRRREPSFSEHEPLMYQPPPAYSETPPPSQPSAERPAIYSTFPFQHLERGFPLARQEPQSMGGPIADATNEDTPLMRSWKFPPQRKRTKALLLAGFVLVVIGTTLSVLLGCSEVGTAHSRLMFQG